MKYQVHYDNPEESLIQRLLTIRKIDDHVDDFLYPTFAKYWVDPWALQDMDKAIARIRKAMQNNEKIMIFGDYDVDGITSSFLIYKTFTKFLGYKNISIRLPNRLDDGYGIKDYHIDEIKKSGCTLIITVDNGITAIQESLYATSIGIDMIITDHHSSKGEIPQAIAVIDPVISPDYIHKEIAGVGVAMKLGFALITEMISDSERKKDFFAYMMPIVALGTVADCVPLIGENRLFVKKGLEYINKRKGIPASLASFLDYLKIKDQVDSFHIGYIIAPRLNAGGRMISPYDSLKVLLHKGEVQKEHIDNIEALNTERKKIQDSSAKDAEKTIDKSKNIMIARSEEYHEGIIGIVAGKLTEKYHKPSLVISINSDKGIAVGSLRGPEYFSVIDMLYQAGDLLDRFGGHKQAGGLTVKIENLEKLIENLYDYCDQKILPENIHKTLYVDTKLYAHEFQDHNIIDQINLLQPFGEGNEEPTFLVEDAIIQGVEKVGQKGNGHMKIYATCGEAKFHALFRGKGDQIDTISRGENINLIGKLRKDNYNGGFYIDGDIIV